MSSKNMHKSELFADILGRIKNIKGLHSDAQVAKTLNMTRNNLYGFKKRGKIPHEQIQKFCAAEGIRIDYVMSGIGPVHDQPVSTIAEPSDAYPKNHLRRGDDNSQIRISDILQKVTYIMESNTPHKNAIVMAVDACYQSVRADEKVAEQENKIQQLEEKLKLLAG